MKRFYKIVVVFVGLILGCGSCNKAVETEPKPIVTDLEQIKKRGKLIALTDYNSTGYFIYKGRPMGYHYDMLSELAKSLNVRLQIIIKADINEAIRMVNNGEADILAYNLIVTKEKESLINFTQHLNTVRQVLIQRKPKKWQFMTVSQIQENVIKSPIDLAGKTIHVRYASAHYQRLKKLAEAIGGDIRIIQDQPDTETEEMIRKVAREEIDYTIAEEHVAYVNSKNYSNIDISLPLSFPQKLAWATAKNSPELLKTVDSWITGMKKTTEFYTIYDKYYKSTKMSSKRAASKFFSLNGSQISPYDSLIKVHAKAIGWDWRLLASLIRHESGFNPSAASGKGAVGLMQLLPSTAIEYGAINFTNPEESLIAGTKYLSFLDKFWKKRIPNAAERIKFVLGSYNAGQGHVLDAYLLAKKYEKDSSVWDENVAYYLLQKMDPIFYKDPIVKRGFCNGTEAVNYVNNIFETYEHYKKVIKI